MLPRHHANALSGAAQALVIEQVRRDLLEVRPPRHRLHGPLAIHAARLPSGALVTPAGAAALSAVGPPPRQMRVWPVNLRNRADAAARRRTTAVSPAFVGPAVIVNYVGAFRAMVSSEYSSFAILVSEQDDGGGTTQPAADPPSGQPIFLSGTRVGTDQLTLNPPAESFSGTLNLDAPALDWHWDFGVLITLPRFFVKITAIGFNSGDLMMSGFLRVLEGVDPESLSF